MPTNKVIRTTYLLLSLTLAFAAVAAGVSAAFVLLMSGLLQLLGFTGNNE